MFALPPGPLTYAGAAGPNLPVGSVVFPVVSVEPGQAPFSAHDGAIRPLIRRLLL